MCPSLDLSQIFLIIFLRVLFLAFVQQKYKIFQKIKEMKCEMRLPAAQFVIMGIIN